MEIFNKTRKVSVSLENNIAMADWKKHFITLLDGAESEVHGMKRDVAIEGAGVERLLAAGKRLTKRKAFFPDGISNET